MSVLSASTTRRQAMAVLLPSTLLAGPTSQAAAAIPVLGGPPQLCQSILLPAYFYPSGPPYTEWEEAIAGAPTLKYLIANPGNGPGITIDANYTAVIDQVRSAGITVLGYVYTSYAARSLDEVRADIARWREFYGVKSIFVDEVSSDGAELPYYRKLAKTIRRTRKAKIVLNPGTVPQDQGYLRAGDVIVVFEGTAAVYESFSFPAWTLDNPAKRFAHLVYDVADASAMEHVIDLAKARNAGNVFVTSGVLPNPWDGLPSYWAAELNAAGCA